MKKYDVKHDDDEPDEWETAEPLFTNEVLGVALCKYTGTPAAESFAESVCTARVARRHPDEDCIVMFWSTPAILSGNIPTDMVAPVVTANNAGITYMAPVEP